MAVSLTNGPSSLSSDILTGFSDSSTSLLPTVDPDDFSANTSTTGSITVGGSRSGVVNFDGEKDGSASPSPQAAPSSM